MSAEIVPSDLTQRPPRRMRARLGGFVLLPRILDKGRATLPGKNGVYNYNSPTDQYLVRFLGLDLEALLKELAKGKGDGEILEWVLANSKAPRMPWEADAWSAYIEKRGPDSDAETLTGFAEYIGQQVADEDFVIVHGRFSDFGLPVSWIAADILGIKDGILLEHWDVIQDEASRQQSKSGLPMFGGKFSG
jgi:hypothetical protein